MTTTGRAPRSAMPRPGALLQAAHIGPVVAVTAITALLAVADDLAARPAILVVAAVCTGQLTIGWANDLIDADRDRRAGRTDKPLASGQVSERSAVLSLAVAGVACIALSAAVGWRSGLVNVVLGAGSGHAYNAGLKATAWSWLPYALAFGTLPAVVSLAGESPEWPPLWTLAAAAALGVGSHFLNTLPDLADDEAAGVRGLPHRLGAGPARWTAAALMVGASVLAVLGPEDPPAGWMWVALAAVVGLGAVTLAGRGKAPFYAAIAIALVDVSLLVAGSR